MYKQYFSYIISISQANISENSNIIISCRNSNEGRLSYICIKKVYEKYPNFKGYLIINEENIMKPWELKGINQNIPWINMFGFTRFYFNTFHLEEMIKII